LESADKVNNYQKDSCFKESLPFEKGRLRGISFNKSYCLTSFSAVCFGEIRNRLCSVKNTGAETKRKETDVIGGYMGKILFVDLSTGEIKEEALDEKICRDYIGGYGIGARILYSRQKAGVDPMGPENTLGFVTGPLTGSGVPTGSRFMVVAKSPLTGGW